MFHNNNFKTLKNPRVPLHYQKNRTTLLALPGTDHSVFCVGDSLRAILGDTIYIGTVYCYTTQEYCQKV